MVDSAYFVMQKKYFLTNSMQGVSSKSYLLPSFIREWGQGPLIWEN